jgi:adenine-specific DNA-methyltransferase
MSFPDEHGPVAYAEELRINSFRHQPKSDQAELGQFFTPTSIARLMASMFELESQIDELRVLDPGAGLGALTAAFVERVCLGNNRPKRIVMTGFEVDRKLLEPLHDTHLQCKAICQHVGIEFISEILNEDFIDFAANCVSDSLFAQIPVRRFNFAILNPPYRKISSDSHHRRLLSHIGIETTNLYSAFLQLTVNLLDPGGQTVAIVPRSFCNGTYFKPFRLDLLKQLCLKQIHVYESRNQVFKQDSVLQENIILFAKKQGQGEIVVISSSTDPEDTMLTAQAVPFRTIVNPDDPEAFIHIVTSGVGENIIRDFARLQTSLTDLGLAVSTGPVVDFRTRENLRDQPGTGTVPLIYPTHLENRGVRWPKESKKPNAILHNLETQSLLVPNDTYVLVKRFTSKEESKRVVAAVFSPKRFDTRWIGLENHLNYYHCDGKGIDADLASGLTLFLNSTAVDSYFRQFNGHTQINANDLRNLRYPTEKQLRSLGLVRIAATQEEIDQILRDLLWNDTGIQESPTTVIKKVKDAENILKQLGLPKEQQNERSALTLLALLNLKPRDKWTLASRPLRGITPMMEFFSKQYGKNYKPNTRETVRRQTVHQMLDAGLITANPDDPNRPINSPKAVYQIREEVLELVKTFGTESWNENVQAFLLLNKSLRDIYAQEREMQRIPVQISEHQVLQLSPGGQNILVEQIVHEFGPRYTPGGRILYVGDTDLKFAWFDKVALQQLDVVVDAHGKMPDVIIHFVEKNWLILVEAVTSHGPINPHRRAELSQIFKSSSAGLVFVTAFLTRAVLAKYIGQISWATEVWVAESPTHLIHFNGERFLGPYEKDHG